MYYSRYNFNYYLYVCTINLIKTHISFDTGLQKSIFEDDLFVLLYIGVNLSVLQFALEQTVLSIASHVAYYVHLGYFIFINTAA